MAVGTESAAGPDAGSVATPPFATAGASDAWRLPVPATAVGAIETAQVHAAGQSESTLQVVAFGWQ